jgi:hypothetical protein
VSCNTFHSFGETDGVGRSFHFILSVMRSSGDAVSF